jgi:maltooligosyltrehalose trehalohydrolase
MTITVWAPRAQRVRVGLDGETVEMTSDAAGWWTAELGELGELASGTRYGFLLDADETPLPDPRSRWQPEGVHARSAIYHHDRFEWSDQVWGGRALSGAVIYELHVGTFTSEGTLDATIERLPHLVELGVDFVELLPVNAFEGRRNWGYDGVLWFAVDDSYGGPAAYQRFVDACHHHGLGVIQDVVYNHLGPAGNYLPRFAPYLREGAANAWGAEIDLDRREVRDYIIDNAVMWLRDYHVDALRIDAVHALTDHRPKHVLAELADRTAALSRQLGRPLTLIAESDLNDPIVITPTAGGGWGMDAQWSDDFHHALHVALTGEMSDYYADFHGIDALAKTIERGFFHDGGFSSYRGTEHGRPIDKAATPTWRLVVFDQNHDQIGNRVVGDRLGATLTADQLAVAAVLVLSSPYTPMLFMGEEWAASTPWQFFSDYLDPALGTATSEGRAKEFAGMGFDLGQVPDPQDPATFERSKLDWGELDEPAHRRMLTLYRQLLQIRRSVPALTDPRFENVRVEHDQQQRWIVVHRGPSVVIAANLADSAVTLPIGGRLLLSTSDASEIGSTTSTLSGWSAAVVSTS